MSLADLHFHLLPGVDDGPADLPDALELAQAALREGTETVVATPHVRSDLGLTDAAVDAAAGLRRELAAGAASQLNALSLTGAHGDEARRAAWALLADGLVSVVASDAHGPSRPPVLRVAQRALLEGGIAPDAARRLVESRPRDLLARGLTRSPAVAA
jgi:tyrosine-protein phosphatase YwqE